MTERDDLHLLTGAYALNALNEAEKAEFENYLSHSEEARTEVTELSDTAVMLGLSSPPVTPSPEFKARLMAMISTTEQLPAKAEPLTLVPDTIEDAPARVSAPSAVPAPVTAATAPTTGPSAEEQRDIRALSAEASARPGSAEARAQSRWYRKPLNALVAAAAAVALFAGGAVLGQGLGTPDTQVAQADSLAELTMAADVTRSVSEVAGGGTATMIWSDELGRSAVMVEGLPELGADEVYQLWYIGDAGATGAGLFASDADGTAWHVLEGEMADATAVGVTVEPTGGSEQPTTTPIVVLEDV